MSSEQTLEAMTPDERSRIRKKMADDAVKLAVSSRWEEAAGLNREFLRVFGDEAEAFNRLGKALSEIGQITEARNSYSRSLELDPTNTIARRNLDRLANMQDTNAMATTPSQLDTRLFVEETGKSATTTLQAVDPGVSASLDPGDVVELEAQGNAVNIRTTSGEYIGMVEPRVGLRLAKMMAAGNQYAAALVSTDGDIRVMVRETFQHPSLIGRVSFPQARGTDVRGYTRKGLLRGTDELEFGSDEDEIEDEETDEGWSETGDEVETRAGVEVNEDDESFD